MSAPLPSRTAPDGSPYPDRDRPDFEREVRAMFTHIARGYEGFDHLASLGQDLLWRPMAIWAVDRYRAGRAVARVLDVGCGTGEFSRLVARHFRDARVTGLDFTDGMLRRAAAHPRRENRGPQFVRGSALSLPIADRSIDLCTSAFLLRNLSDLGQGFREIHRVLRPGGTMLALEITEPEGSAFRSLFHAYFDHVVPALGAAVGSAGPYRYLPDSLRSLPSRAHLLALLGESGLDRAQAHPLSGGTVTSYLASAPETL
ncbi:MAG: ubiquinone/menaquinone biosynthesis methyltransferase [Thermoplasmata archaeon]|nr:ubiquinone/menaquinone biosynthesis methyltransferase [Thermoplasmata archaeon]